ncbi:hypothetical protein [Novosphingobium sp. MMS21-SN21R]|uniref:hypothetical protein n=1 Tax=Novosphingobium sp. MMS21-SN21R TaxID=2969298 RepID=UPI00288508AF|nr:hypothetical protein [Novosphingobium sp. MMS21-SN21R]MDT0509436.1 hypothetical protein [Novosphingobium sp. MMS21-SN21R]
MVRSCLVAALASALVFHLGGCQKGPASPAPEPVASETVAVAPTPTPAAQPPLAPTGPGKPSYARNPIEALDAFAATIEARDWKALRGFWGDKGERSGMSEEAFAAKWSTLLAPEVSVGTGTQEGAAGSLYYTAPVTIVDGKRTLRGEVTIRRVNDVDGASTEQLRWHVESTTLAI